MPNLRSLQEIAIKPPPRFACSTRVATTPASQLDSCDSDPPPVLAQAERKALAALEDLVTATAPDTTRERRQALDACIKFAVLLETQDPARFLNCVMACIDLHEQLAGPGAAHAVLDALIEGAVDIAFRLAVGDAPGQSKNFLPGYYLMFTRLHGAWRPQLRAASSRRYATLDELYAPAELARVQLALADELQRQRGLASPHF